MRKDGHRFGAKRAVGEGGGSDLRLEVVCEHAREVFARLGVTPVGVHIAALREA